MKRNRETQSVTLFDSFYICDVVSSRLVQEFELQENKHKSIAAAPQRKRLKQFLIAIFDQTIKKNKIQLILFTICFFMN